MVAVVLWNLIQRRPHSSVSPVEGFNDTEVGKENFQSGVAGNFEEDGARSWVTPTSRYIRNKLISD